MVDIILQRARAVLVEHSERFCGGRHWNGGSPMIDHQPWSLQRRTLLAGFAALAASTVIGGNPLMAAIEQNTVKRRGVGLRACEPERAFPGFTLFAPHFVQNRNVYLIDLQGEVVHTWNMARDTVLQRAHVRGELSEPLPVQRWRRLGSRLEWQSAVECAPPGPSSSRHPAAQRQRAAALHGRGTR